MSGLETPGRATARAMLEEVGPLFTGRSLAIELGCGNGAVLLGFAGSFERVRGVDADPVMLRLLEQQAGHARIGNAEVFLIDQPWDEPTGAADYVYALHLFRQLEDWVASATYLQRISMALRRGGIAHLRFDTRRPDLAHRLRQRLPDRLLAPAERRDARPVRRRESWVRDRVRGADLEIIGEHGAGTAEHWVVARRR